MLFRSKQGKQAGQGSDRKPYRFVRERGSVTAVTIEKVLPMIDRSALSDAMGDFRGSGNMDNTMDSSLSRATS